MDKISLLPQELKDRRANQRTIARLSFVLFLIVLVLVVINVFFLVTNYIVQRNLQALIIEREQVQREADALQEYQDLYEEFTAVENVLGNAMGTVPPWGILFRDLSRTLAPSAWLSDLTVSYSDQAGTLNLSGWAHDHIRLADTLEQIYNLEQLDQVRTRTTTGVDYQGREAIQFNVDAVVLTGPAFTDVEPDDLENDNDQQDGE